MHDIQAQVQVLLAVSLPRAAYANSAASPCLAMLKRPLLLFEDVRAAAASATAARRERLRWASLFSCDRDDFANHTLWFLGNSVSRIHFFAALAMLSGEGEPKQIEEQVRMCGKGGEWRGRRPGQGVSCLGPCACSATVPGGGRLAFVWQQRTFDKMLGPALLGELALSGLRVQAGDLVFFNAGLDNVVDCAKKAFTKKTKAIRLGQLVGDNLTRHAATQKVKWNESLQEDAPRLARALAAAQHMGRRVFWRSSSPVCFEPDHKTNWGMCVNRI